MIGTVVSRLVQNKESESCVVAFVAQPLAGLWHRSQGLKKTVTTSASNNLSEPVELTIT
jgi:hypothetical protein